MQEKLIVLGESDALIQWGEGKAILSISASAIALDADGMDSLISALLRARGQMIKRERATLYARVPHALKSKFLAKALEEGLSQNAAIIEAVRNFLDPMVIYQGK